MSLRQCAASSCVVVGVMLALAFVAGCREPETSGGDSQIANGGKKAAAPPTAPSGGSPTAANAAAAAREALAEFNRGAAYMEQYQYTQAADAFEKTLKLAPDWTAARFNLGLAYLNLQGKRGEKDSLDLAEQTFLEVLKAEPQNLHAIFSLGMYYQHLGDADKTLKYFEMAYKRSADDPYVAYKYAEALLAKGPESGPQGTELLEKIVAAHPGFASAVYRLAMQHQRAGQREKAKPLFDRFRALDDADLAAGPFKVGKVYGEAGRYSFVLGPDALPLARAKEAKPPAIVFSPETRVIGNPTVAWKWQRGTAEKEADTPAADGQAGGEIGLPGLTAEDFDGDGDLDLCLTALDERGRTATWLNDGKGNFTAGTSLGDQGIAPTVGDVDNDGDVDVWLGRAGGGLLLENDGKGTFQEAKVTPGFQDGLLTSAARLVDVDSDGDLDLVACRMTSGVLPADAAAGAAAIAIYNNNRDGTFEDIAEKLGLTEPVAGAVPVFDDFDNDRDLDLVLFSAGDAPPLVWINDRVWQHHTLPAAEAGLDVHGVVSATTGDPDKDGDCDLLVWTRDGLALYRNQGDGRFRGDEKFRDQFGGLGGTAGQFVDLDNDGDLDLVLADAHRSDGSRGPAVLANLWPSEGFADAGQIDPALTLNAIKTPGDASCIAADFTGDGKCDVVMAAIGEAPMLVENATPGGHWIGLKLVGTRGQDQKTRSATSAVGSRAEVKTGMVFQQYGVGGASGAVAMPPLRVHAGLGENPKLEWLRIIWPDGILQGEVELPGDQVATIEENNRKPSSCPHLFAWTGEHFEFVSDFGGVGGLGYLAAPGEYAAPDPTEYVVLPPLAAEDGLYVLQVLEPLEETVYFDEAKLLAVDHPRGTTVYPNEMAAVNLPPPAFELFCIGQAIEPKRATDHRGADVTEALRQSDRVYAGATELDERFVGYAREHTIELDFGERLASLATDGRLVLFLEGWVEYAYSSTNFAAAQAGLRLKAPSLEVWRDGRWVEIYREAGYPAGIRHTMTLDLTGRLGPEDRKLRIRSNMELFWDRVFLAAPGGNELATTEVRAASADLHYLGYPREYSPDGRHPNLYDYANVDSAVAWKLMEGEYTRYGEVAELLHAADDCYAIMGRGEEITLRFPADALGPVPPGMVRTFLLKTDSYCKDMDLYTAHPDTVGPLPFHAMSGYPYPAAERYPETLKTREYRAQYNTRRVRTR